MRRLLALLLLLPLLAQAQSSPVYQSGTPTPGHVAAWVASGVVKDGGTATQGGLNSLGLYGNGGTPLCITNSQTPAPFSGKYSQLCLGASQSAMYLMDNSYGGATHLPFNLIMNGNTVLTASDTGVTIPGLFVPAGGSNGQIQYNAGGFLNGFTMSGDATINTSTGVLTITGAGGVPFGTAAFDNTGTSGATIPLNNGNNTSSGNQTHTGTENFTGTIEIGGTAVTLPVPVAIGGTGATTAWQAQSALCPGRSIPSGTSDTATTADCGVRWNSAATSAKTQVIPACTSGNDGYKISVIDEIGTASTYSITITPVSGTILNTSGLIIPVNLWSFTLRCDGAHTNYYAGS